MQPGCPAGRAGAALQSSRRPRVPDPLQSGSRSWRAQTPPSHSALPVRLPVKNSNLTATRRNMRKWPRPRCSHHTARTSWRGVWRESKGAPRELRHGLPHPGDPHAQREELLPGLTGLGGGLDMALHGAARLSRGCPTRTQELGTKPAPAAPLRTRAQPDAGHSDQRAPQTARPSHQEVAAPRRLLIGCGGEPGRASKVQPAPERRSPAPPLGEEPCSGHAPRPCLGKAMKTQWAVLPR